MAAYDKYDKRVDGLVVENVTLWDKGLEKVSPKDKEWLAAELHAHAELASNVAYERAHTGFTRTITVSIADVERLYQQKVAG